jgi:restriction system protein
VRGSLGAHEQGLIITTSEFSAGAIKEANQLKKTPVALMNGEQLVTLLMEYNIGVRRMPHDLFELEELPIAEKENDLENKGLK